MTPLSFNSEKERQQWIIDHADYFTVVSAKFRNRDRYEVKTLPLAEALAHSLLQDGKDRRFMIYAVKGPEDTFVKVIS